MLILMNKTTPVAKPMDDGPSGIVFLHRGEEYDVAEHIGAALIRGGEAQAVEAKAEPAPVESATVETTAVEEPARGKPAGNRGPVGKKDRGAAPENK